MNKTMALNAISRTKLFYQIRHFQSCLYSMKFKVISLHLFVICASLPFSDENCSSKSKRSRAGGGNSLNCGGNTYKNEKNKMKNVSMLIAHNFQM